LSQLPRYAPAFANAIVKLTGKRLREMPFIELSINDDITTVQPEPSRLR
jgi:hypothetical protein